jgi:Flp pilus assembly pilin Flp
MLKKLLALFHIEKGQDMIEYALISALLSLVIVVAAAGILDLAFADWATDLASQISTLA